MPSCDFCWSFLREPARRLASAFRTAPSNGRGRCGRRCLSAVVIRAIASPEAEPRDGLPCPASEDSQATPCGSAWPRTPPPIHRFFFPLFFSCLVAPPPPCGVFCNPRCIRACRVQRRFARFAFPRPNRRLCCVTSFLFRCSITWGAACGLPPGLAPARPRPRTAAAPDTSLLSGRRRGLGGYF